MFVKYCSSLLPLVRKHEFILIKELLGQTMSRDDINVFLLNNVSGCNQIEVDHTIKFMVKKGALIENAGMYSLNVTLDNELIKEIEDILEYGITQYETTYRNTEKFVLWHNYRMDQVLLKMLSDPDHNQKGTYFYGDEAIVFASLKKDASIEEKLAYKDKFLTSKTFQWECENNISERDLQALRLSKYVHLFIRKVMLGKVAFQMKESRRR